MIVAVYNIQAYQADTLRFFVDFFEDGNPYDLTQFSEWKMQVKKTPAATLSYIDLSLGDGLSISSNRMNIEVSKERMNIDPLNYVYDIEGNNVGGDRKTILQGAFNIEADVTR
jgi:hypothetical protein